MFWTSVFRILKMGLTSMWRNGWLTITAISVIFLVFLSVNVFLIFGNSFNNAIKSIESKVDFTIYFKADATDDQILSVRNTLANNPQVRETHYISKEEALEINLREKPEIKEVVIDYGNPFSASLDVKAVDPQSLDKIAKSIESDSAIKKIKYSKQTIDAINRGTRLIRSIGLFLIIFLVLISFLVVLNTVRLTIYTRRVEIEIMKLVGANNWFIRWPFVVEAIYDGVAAALLSTLVLYLSFDRFSAQLVDLSDLLKIPFPSFGLLTALKFAVVQMAAGGLLGALSAYAAIRRHMRF